MAFSQPPAKAPAKPTSSTPAAPATPIRLPSNSSLSVNFLTTSTTNTPTTDATASKPIRLLAYGPPKTRKTWWSASAASRLRTTLLDGDTNTGILNQLPPESLANVQILPMTQIGYSTVFPTFLHCLGGDKFGRQFAFPLDGTLPVKSVNFGKPNIIKTERDYLVVNLDALTPGDLLIVDSYTTLVNGITHIYNRDRDIDPMKGEILDETDSNKYRYFRYHEAVIKELFSILRKLPCNIIITGHSMSYETEVMVGKSKQKFGNIQLVSYSGTDGARAPALCSDVLYFTPSLTKNTETIIEATSEDYRIGGCTHIPPGSYKFPNWDFSAFLDAAKLSYPSPDLTESTHGPWVTRLSGAEILANWG